jgi:hypothetical protein
MATVYVTSTCTTGVVDDYLLRQGCVSLAVALAFHDSGAAVI